jgi:hypothetical protein
MVGLLIVCFIDQLDVLGAGPIGTKAFIVSYRLSRLKRIDGHSSEWTLSEEQLPSPPVTAADSSVA